MSKKISFDVKPIYGLKKEDIEHLDVEVITIDDRNPPNTKFVITITVPDQIFDSLSKSNKGVSIVSNP